MLMTGEFAKQFGADFLEHVFYVIYGDVKDDSIYISRETKHDAINKSGFGYFEKDGVEYGFEWRDGDWDGSQIISYGPELSDNHRETREVLVPDKMRLIGEIRLAHQDWTEEQVQKWYQDVTLKIFEHKKKSWDEEYGKLAYDVFFQPTSATRKRRMDWLREKFLTVERVYVDTGEPVL